MTSALGVSMRNSKVGVSPSKKIFFICFKESPLKAMKPYLKGFFVLKITIILSWTFGHIEKRAWLESNLKIYDVTTWFTNNCNKHIPNISRSKGNQTMKFGQVIEYNKSSVFLKNMEKMRQGD